MALLTLHRKQRSKWAVPYWICINGCPLGLMRTPEVNMKMPAGTFTVEMKIMFKVWKWTGGLGGRKTVTMGENDHLHIHITDRERWWNWLFNLDLVLWLVRFCFTLPDPWGLVYHIVSDGFFVVWLLRLWIIRKRYFKLEIKE